MEKHLFYSLLVCCCIFYGIAAQNCNTEVAICAQKILPTNDDFSKSCSIVQPVKTCLNTVKDKCSGNSVYQSIKTSLDNLELMCANIKTISAGSSADDSDPGETGSCAMAAAGCLQTLGNVSDQTKVCVNYQQFRTCWEPIEIRCADDKTFASLQSQIAPVIALCDSDDCGQSLISECSNIGKGLDFVRTNWTLGVLSKLCQEIENFQQKCITKVESCSNLLDLLKSSGVNYQQYLEMVRQIRRTCENQIPALSKYSSCLSSKVVSVRINQCGEMVDGMSLLDQNDLSVDDMCDRLMNVKACTETAVGDCGEDTTRVIGPVISDIIKSFSGNAGLNCPSNTATGQRSDQMVFGIVCAVLLIFIERCLLI